ncbi:hypothetical protein DL96DRAFT_463769 [Flagelloscypha sp. PMI_526]|nr:hypothetical protein DL96DRAFT_463769 [Flagelloscypha sp. PMI_526]
MDSTARSSLDPSCHSTIDINLKALRTTSRECRLSLRLYQHEIRVLSRVFYKNKNQHRAAQFWHRFSEILRWSKREHCITFCSVLHTIRASFWDTADTSFKSPWNTYPGETKLLHFKSHLSSLQRSLTQFQNSLENFYRSLKLMMQSPAFAPLILMLTASCARLHFLLQKFMNSIALVIDSLESLILSKDCYLEPSVNTSQPQSSEARTSTQPSLESGPKLPALEPSLKKNVKPKLVSVTRKSATQVTQLTNPINTPKVKPKRKQRDEIDDIFRL